MLFEIDLEIKCYKKREADWSASGSLASVRKTLTVFIYTQLEFLPRLRFSLYAILITGNINHSSSSSFIKNKI